MRRMSRLLLVGAALLLATGFAVLASAQGQVERTLQKGQEKAAGAAPTYEVQAASPAGVSGGSGLNVKGRFNCRCNGGKGVCALIQKDETLQCKPGVLSGCTSCIFATSTEEMLAPQ